MTDLEIIAVDFDGTLCVNKFPSIGQANYRVIDYLKERKEQHGAKLILWTCRTRKALEEAVAWCKQLGLEFDAVNDNVPPTDPEYTDNPRKVFATEYIDDRSCTKFKLPFTRDYETVPESDMTNFGYSLACGDDPTGELLTPYGKYVTKFALHHNMTVMEAHQHPMCQSRLDYFKRTGE